MNNVQNVGNVVVKNVPQPNVESKQNNLYKVNFRADGDQFVRKNDQRSSRPAILQQHDPMSRMIEEQEKAQKKEKRREFLNTFAVIAGILGAGAIVYSVIKGQNAGKVSAELVEKIKACDVPALKKLAESEYAKGPHMCSEKKIRDILALAEVSKTKACEIDIVKAIDIMNEKIVDMPEVKEQVTDFLIEQAYNASKGIKNKKPLVLCLDGPAGTGKTTVSEVIAEALGMPYKKIAMGGTTGTSVIRGTESKFVGSEAGGIAKGQLDSGNNRVLYCLDEVDKLGKSEQHGSAESALLSLFDDQAKFADDFLGAELDISNSIFVLTTNDVNKLSTPLKNRLRIMNIAPYGLDTKTKIAKMHLNKLVEEAKLTDDVIIKEDAFKQIADMTSDGGGRETVNKARELVRKMKLQTHLGEVPEGGKITVDANYVKKNLTFDKNGKLSQQRVKDAVAEGRMKTPVAEETQTATAQAEKGAENLRDDLNK